MTTIAYREGFIASDSLINDNGTRLSHARVKKLHRLSAYRVVGTSGGISQSQRLLTWISGGEVGPRPNLSDAAVFDVTCEPGADVRLRVHDIDGCYEVEADYFAIGSGKNYALAAMRAGASAREAVEIACEFDENSGGQIMHTPVMISRLAELDTALANLITVARLREQEANEPTQS